MYRSRHISSTLDVIKPQIAIVAVTPQQPSEAVASAEIGCRGTGLGAPTAAPGLPRLVSNSIDEVVETADTGQTATGVDHCTAPERHGHRSSDRRQTNTVETHGPTQSRH